MSNFQRPGVDRQISIHPALRDDVTRVPVTPGVLPEGTSAYTELKRPDSARSQATPLSESTPGLAWGSKAQSGFDADGRPTSPTEVAAGARTGEELLKRLSLGGATAKQADGGPGVDPRVSYEGLGLSGRIITATFCVPYSIGHSPGHNWELGSRRGTSALYDSFAYLSSPESKWKHTLVGWTGEVKSVEPQSAQQASNATSMGVTPLNKSSAPIPLDANTPAPEPGLTDSIRVSREDRDRLEVQLEREHGGKIVPVWLADESEKEGDDMVVLKDQARWRKYAEHELYTMFHYKQNEPTDGRDIRKSWADYYRMNRLFADRIVEIYKPGDIVLIHDYYLLLLPSLLRQRLQKVYIGFFLHIPFPSSEFYRCLSRRKEILEGVLGANMIGFQAFSYSRHFSSCCTRILGFESSSAGVDAYGAHVAVDVLPIGIHAQATQKAAFDDPRVDEKIAGIKELYEGKKVIVGRDRLDSVRGVAQKLQAFEVFLEQYPEWRGKAVLIQVTSPTGPANTKDDAEDNKTANKISDLVTRINGKFGSINFSPVQHFPQYLSREEYFALLRVADVGLITSVRDGMNTTSLEYVVCQKDHCGPLILSEFSGTAGSLGAAIHINPWDLGGVAAALHRALIMSPEERKKTEDRLYRHVTTNTVQAWTNRYLKRLLTNLASFDQAFATPVLDRARLLGRYRNAKHRLFMFDYDGTLTPIVKDPQSAIPSDRVIRSIKRLASDPCNSVWIISGRDQAFLDEWMGHIGELGLSAEHGSFMRKPGREDWEDLTQQIDMGWQDRVAEVFGQWTEKVQGSFVERKKIALTWHYRRADPTYGAYQAIRCQQYLEEYVVPYWPVEVMQGKANLEVRPRLVNKGEIAKRLLREMRQDHCNSSIRDGEVGSYGESPDFVLCLGDDFTDEDMFRALAISRLSGDNVFSVTVGASSKQTLARWHLLEPADVISVIALLNGSTDSGNVGAVSVVEGNVPDPRI
ncbi:MAG: threalose-6-phosphate phosphatase [Bathelium mastoideum]|nr:MAG: threalose-6-phosphate phosphatase [Bathelium mastoideum]